MKLAAAAMPYSKRSPLCGRAVVRPISKLIDSFFWSFQNDVILTMPPPKSLLSLFRLSLLHSNVPKIVLPTVLFLLAIMQALTQPPHTQYIKEGKEGDLF